MKSHAMADKYKGTKLTDQQWDSIHKDYMTGLSKDVIMKKYKLNSAQYKEIRNYILSPNNPTEGQQIAMEHNYMLNTIRKSGAKRQGRNDICLCGSGKKYKFCCGK